MMKKGLPTLSVVVPVRNEAENILPLAEEIRTALDGRFDYEIIFVNDGSTDGTQAQIQAAQEADPRVHWLSLRPGVGQTGALDAGFKAATGDYVAMMDGDGQNDPADLPRLFDAMGDADMACGYRAKRQDSLKRKLVSRIANAARNKITHEKIRDVGCSIRVFKRACLKDIKLFHGMHRFLPTLFRIEGYRFVEIEVNHRPRTRGQTKYGTWDRFKEGLYDLCAVRWMQKRHISYNIVERWDGKR